LRRLILTLSLLFICSTSWAGNIQVFPSGRPDDQPSNSGTVYSSLLYRGGWGTTVSTDGRNAVSAIGGTVKKLCVRLTAAPGSGKSRVFTVQKNGSDESMAVTLSDSATEACNTTTFTFDANDQLRLKQVPSSTPTAAGATWYTVIEYAADNVSILAGQGFESGSNGYLAITGRGNPSTTTTDREFVLPIAATAKSIYARVTTAVGSGVGYTLTVRKNGTATDIECEISGTSDTTCSLTTESVSFDAGDRLGVYLTRIGSPVGRLVKVSVGLENEAGYFMFGVLGMTLSNSATQYTSIAGASNMSMNATETNRQQITEAITVTAGRVRLSGSPGSGKSYALTLRDDAADTSTTCTVSDTAEVCTMSTNSTVAADSLMTTKVVPSDTPTARNAGIFYAAYNTLPDPPEPSGNSNFFMFF